MDASAWTRIKRGKALSSGVGLIQPNTSGDVLMERRFVNGPILFNGKIVSECCDPTSATSAEVGTIVLQFSPFTENTLSIQTIDGTGTVDFGNGIILPISSIVTGQIYLVGSTVIIRSSDITELAIQGQGETQGLTSIMFNNGLPLFRLFAIRGSDTLTSLDISTIVSSLIFLECAGCLGITSIAGLDACKSLQELTIGGCSLSGPLDVRSFAATLISLACGFQPITDIVGLNACKSLQDLTIGGCSLSGPLNIRSFAATLQTLICEDQPITEIVGLDTCTKLFRLECQGCALSGPLDITLSAETLTYFYCYYNSGITAIAGLAGCTQLINLNCDGCSLSDPLNILGSAATIEILRCNGNAGITTVDVTGCNSLGELACDGCSILQGTANTIVSALVANGFTGGTLAILGQQTGTLNSSGWTALGDETGSTGLGWKII